MILRNLMITVVMLFVVVLMTAGYSFSQSDPAEVNTLKGLKGIGVSVGNIDTDAAADGLSKTKLLTSITEKLKKSDIKVFTDLELRTIGGQPTRLFFLKGIPVSRQSHQPGAF